MPNRISLDGAIKEIDKCRNINDINIVISRYQLSVPWSELASCEKLTEMISIVKGYINSKYSKLPEVSNVSKEELVVKLVEGISAGYTVKVPNEEILMEVSGRLPKTDIAYEYLEPEFLAWKE